MRRFMTRHCFDLGDYLIMGSYVAHVDNIRANLQVSLLVSTSLSVFIISNDVLHLQDATLEQTRKDLQVQISRFHRLRKPGHIFSGIPSCLGFMVNQIFYFGFFCIDLFSVLPWRVLPTFRASIKLFIRLTAIYLALALIGCAM